MDLTGLLPYLVGLATTSAIYALFALGLNLHWGYSGLFNIGIAGFFLVGAYTSALLTQPPATTEYVQYIGGLSLPFVAGIAGAALAGAFLALLLGLPTVRLRGDYLAIATIGVAEILRLILLNENWIANGSRGLVGITQPFEGIVPPSEYGYVYLTLVLIVLIAVYLAIERIVRSPWGRVLRVMSEDEMLVAAVGKSVARFKLQAFVLGSALMGVAGALYAHYVRAITPDTFSPFFGTFLIWVMLLLGGSGSNRGAVLGAFLVWALWSASDILTTTLPLPGPLVTQAFYLRYLLIGLAVLAVLLWRPRGILGEERRVSRFVE